MSNRSALISVKCLTWLGLLAVPAMARAQAMRFHSEDFEKEGTVFMAGPFDAKYELIRHAATNESSFRGRQSELIHLDAQRGNHAYFVHNIGRASVIEALEISIRVKANRPGARLMARAVLPEERDPEAADRPLTVLLRGDAYDSTGTWQRMELREPVKLLKQQQQFLRKELNRDVSIRGAYIDQVMINVYSGPGVVKAYLDLLSVGPIQGDEPAKAVVTRPEPPGSSTPATPVGKLGEVVLERQRLMVNGKPFLFRGIRHTGTPLEVLRDAGFNAVVFGDKIEDRFLAEADRLQLKIVPGVPERFGMAGNDGGPVKGQLTSSGSLVRRELAPLLNSDAVLFWDLGAGLSAEQYAMVNQRAKLVRSVDPRRPLGVDVWDGLRKYSRGVDQVMLGVHRWPLMTSLELPQYRDWLQQRLRLAEPGTYSWTWIQTHLPSWHTQLVYDKLPEDEFQEPIGPQPEQIRLLTYTALGSGVRGLGYWSDRFLADSHAGRDRLLQMALLNRELELLEPLLLSARSSQWIDTENPDVKAAMMQTDHGLLVIPVWMGEGAQLVPGQGAVSNLKMIVPISLGDKRPWQISAGEIRDLPAQRVPGGTEITIPEQGLTSAILLTNAIGPSGLIVKYQNQIGDRYKRDLAAQWAIDLAQEELTKVTAVHREIARMGRTVPGAETLLEDAERRIRLAASHRRDRDLRRAYLEAGRALRPLRVLMRAHWKLARRELTTPVASPYAVSFYSLPRHWRFRDAIARSTLTPNILPDGDFEKVDPDPKAQWQIQEVPSLDPVEQSVERVKEGAHDGEHALRLRITPKNEDQAPIALERTFLAAHSPEVSLTPGSLVRVSVWIRIPGQITASADGVLFYDSAGGEPLAVRLIEAQGVWKQYTLYRRVPASGKLRVTVGLTGIGEVFVDDVKIEPLRESAR